jgi:hypothetical protein
MFIHSRIHFRILIHPTNFLGGARWSFRLPATIIIIGMDTLISHSAIAPP